MTRKGTRDWGLGTRDWGPGTRERCSQSKLVRNKNSFQTTITFHFSFFIFHFLTILLFFLNIGIHAQSNAYLVPRQIYVGDPAVLILPLPPSVPPLTQDAPDIVLTPYMAPPYFSGFPADPDIDFHRITLERRISGSRLIIEFTAFFPGVLQFPVIEIGGERFSGLTVTVNSVIDSRSALILSGPASSLAMPGTALMLYGTMAAAIILILLAVWFVLKGQRLAQKLKEKWKRRRFFAYIKNTERLLRRSVLKEGNKRLLLDKLSDEFRIFLSFLTKENCRSMTASEFEKLHLNMHITDGIPPSFLGDFFRSCDKHRFSGKDINSEDILLLLAHLRSFLNALENAKKEEKREAKRAAKEETKNREKDAA